MQNEECRMKGRSHDVRLFCLSFCILHSAFCLLLHPRCTRDDGCRSGVVGSGHVVLVSPTSAPVASPPPPSGFAPAAAVPAAGGGPPPRSMPSRLCTTSAVEIAISRFGSRARSCSAATASGAGPPSTRAPPPRSAAPEPASSGPAALASPRLAVRASGGATGPAPAATSAAFAERPTPFATGPSVQAPGTAASCWV